ncbi:hypothetical protein WMY93_000130 [Mugilogobius chulae]|uniref:Biliverdin reductase A n=1 Tax=Mugilogobius chulae TaxID=88201 RepID=A0AAW0Q1C4_9GOBI
MKITVSSLSLSEMFGAVVVGLGVAGSVRIRDMLAPLPGSAAEKLAVKGFVSRRSLEPQQGTVEQVSMSDALNRDDIAAAFVCTENESHEETVRQFLAAGKHVCVEYPMTLNYKSALELWDLARTKVSLPWSCGPGPDKGESALELWTWPGTKVSPPWTCGTWPRTKPRFGFLAFSGIARLTWLVDLFGELSVTTATLEEDASNNYSKMTAQLRTADDRALTWIEERGPGLPRAKNIHFKFESFTLTEVPPPASRGAVGLFMQDLVLFGAKLSGQVSSEELQKEKTRVLHCLSLAQKIQDLCQ